jgi:hypothetical protein
MLQYNAFIPIVHQTQCMGTWTVRALKVKTCTSLHSETDCIILMMQHLEFESYLRHTCLLQLPREQNNSSLSALKQFSILFLLLLIILRY